jgi:hypothetical protein
MSVMSICARPLRSRISSASAQLFERRRSFVCPRDGRQRCCNLVGDR